MKPYLLIAGCHYYPSHDTGDWIGCYETEKEAQEQVEFKEIHQYYSKGKNKGEIKIPFTSASDLNRILEILEIKTKL